MTLSSSITTWVVLGCALGACGGGTNSDPDGAPADADAGDAPGADGDAYSTRNRCEQTEQPVEPTPIGPLEADPMFESGLVMPLNSIECTPVSTGVPQLECNHHGSTLAELDDGTIAVAWFHGEVEKSPDSDILWSRWLPGASEWTTPEVLVDDPDRADGNPALWLAPEGTLYTFFVSIFGSEWPDARVRMVSSTDSGDTWSDIVTLRDEPCWMARQEPLLFSDGELLLPLYNECVAVPVFMRTSDRFETIEYLWNDDDLESDYVLGHIGQIQPVLVEREDGSIVAFTRDGSHARRVMHMESTDRGSTWTNSTPTELPNSGTSIDAVRLANDHVALTFNNDPNHRFPLSVALSADEGRTFATIRNILDTCGAESCKYAYPAILQASDGTIWVTYTHDREAIGWAHFNEAWAAAGEEPSRVGCAINDVCEDERCYSPCELDAHCLYDGEVCVEGACRATCAADSDCCGEETCEGGYCETPIYLARCVDDGV